MGITTWVVRASFLLYLIALTTLLLVPDPLAWLFGVVPDEGIPSRGTHFCAFFLLTILTLASRLPWPARVIAALLILYAIVIESLQGLVDGRVVELPDYFENLLGLAVGALTWKLGRRFLRNSRGPSETDSAQR